MRIERKAERVLDRIDLNILHHLQENARLQMKDIAEAVGLTSAPCIDRVRRLEKNKVITGYHARIDPVVLDLSMLVFIEITLADNAGDRSQQFKRELAKVPAVLDCYWVSGRYDYLIKARLRDMAQYRALLSEVLLRLPGVKQVDSTVVIEEIQTAHGLPIII